MGPRIASSAAACLVYAATLACGGNSGSPISPSPAPATTDSAVSGRINDPAVVADVIAFNQDRSVGLSLPVEGPIQRLTGVITRSEPPIPVYVNPSITGAGVADAMAYWQSAVGLSFGLVGSDADARIVVRAASLPELPASEGSGVVYRTYPNNRAQLAVVRIAMARADCSQAVSPACAALYRHEFGHVIRVFDHIPGTGIMSASRASLNASPRELALLQQLYRLPHGARVSQTGVDRGAITDERRPTP